MGGWVGGWVGKGVGRKRYVRGDTESVQGNRRTGIEQEKSLALPSYVTGLVGG